MTQSGHPASWRESEDLPRIEHGREPAIGGDMQQRGASGHAARGRRTTRPKARKASTSARPHTVNTEERHCLVIEAVAEGIYEWSTETNHLELSPRLKQHGGTIEVNTKPSEFTEIR